MKMFILGSLLAVTSLSAFALETVSISEMEKGQYKPHEGAWYVSGKDFAEQFALEPFSNNHPEKQHELGLWIKLRGDKDVVNLSYSVKDLSSAIALKALLKSSKHADLTVRRTGLNMFEIERLIIRD